LLIFQPCSSLRAVSQTQSLGALLDATQEPKQRLLEWSKTLPEHLQTDTQSGSELTDDTIRSHSYLRLSYYTAHILILRALLRPIIHPDTNTDNAHGSGELVLQDCRDMMQSVVQFIRALTPHHQSAYWPAFSRHCFCYPGLFCYMLSLQRRQVGMVQHDQNILAAWRRLLQIRVRSWPLLRFALVKVDALYWKNLP
jgi:hypothetical protein